MPFKADLEDLDKFLRDTWLECCYHLSHFIIDDVVYSSFTDYSDDLSMEVSCDKIFAVGMKFMYEYDFGSTTSLFFEVVSLLKANSKNKIKLLMQNIKPLMFCDFCGKEADFIDHEEKLCCKSCVKDDEDDEYMLPVVNSPRVGVCGYTGPM